MFDTAHDVLHGIAGGIHQFAAGVDLLDRVLDQTGNLPRCRGAALRQPAHFCRHHRKPRPCSPARAASTAAFSARILVWKAMPSMTPMISAILRELSLMPFIVPTTCSTTLPPRPATPLAVITS